MREREETKLLLLFRVEQAFATAETIGTHMAKCLAPCSHLAHEAAAHCEALCHLSTGVTGVERVEHALTKIEGVRFHTLPLTCDFYD